MYILFLAQKELFFQDSDRSLLETLLKGCG